MKTIALLPVKNETWALPSYLSSVTRIADAIIALDDNSQDVSASVLTDAGAHVVRHDFGLEKTVNMSWRRSVLLQKGREEGGTHFIWLDADEMFSADFIPRGREIIARLRPGQKLAMRWVHAWKNADRFNNDPRSPFGTIWKDFVACDDGESGFEDRFLSEARTPGPYGAPLTLPEDEGVVIHWQFARWEVTQYKQALYRCLELVEGSRSPRRINNTYSITLDNPDLRTEPLPEKWTHGLARPALENSLNADLYATQIFALFERYGIETFEPLEIWHLPELQQRFEASVGRAPKSQRFPKWLVALNNIRHGWKN